MDVDSSNSLEIDKIYEGIRYYCLSEAGRMFLNGIVPAKTPHELEERRLFVTGVMKELLEDRVPPAFPAPEIDHEMVTLRLENSYLNGKEFRLIAEYLNSTMAVRNWLLGSVQTVLQNEGEAWPDLSTEAQKLFSLFSSEGELDADKIPSLRKLSQEQIEHKKRREEAAKRLLGDVALKPFWQTQQFSSKDERLVLPLKADFKGKVPGIVHQHSSSGQTLFLEPFEIVELNNDLVRLDEEYRREVIKVLQELTGSLKRRLPEILELHIRFPLMDSALARAIWGYSQHGSFPVYAFPHEAWSLIHARHPLLGKTAVPVSINVPAQTLGMILSGPNTGGKTVFLKTLAVITYFHQIGCPVPVDPDSILPLFGSIYADIGDKQSISASLSTFSAHLMRVKTILENAGSGMLVLLDELGTGTDPQEGGALGVAILEELETRKAFTAVTTHHGTVKQFALTHPNFMNASVEFDANSGRPTYALVQGVTGTSHALDTAERLGLPAQVTRRSRVLLEHSQSQAEKKIASLEILEEEARQKEASLQHREAVLVKLEDEREEANRLFQEKYVSWERDRLMDQERQLSVMRRDFEQLVQKLRQSQADKNDILDTREWMEKTKTEIQNQKEESEKILRAVGRNNLKTWKKGDQAYYKGKRVVLERPGRDGTWTLQAGVLRLEALVEDLDSIEDEKIVQAYRGEVSQTPGIKAVFQLDIRGERAEEAKLLLERQIDRALVDGINEFSVVHGLGEGRLQKVVRDLLALHPHIIDYYYATPEEGGFGKTIVRL